MPFADPPVAAMPAIALSSARRSRKARAVGPRVSPPPGGRALRRPRLVLGCVRGDHAVANAGEAQAVERYSHGVRGEVPGAGPGAGARLPFELVQLLPGGGAALEGAESLPDVLDRHVGTGHTAGPHRAVVEDDPRLVDAGQRHQRGRDGLVAPHEAEHGVEVVRADHQLD